MGTGYVMDINHNNEVSFKSNLESGFEPVNNMVSISEDEYEELKSAKDKLEALEAAGVDNWEGYSYAMESFYVEGD